MIAFVLAVMDDVSFQGRKTTEVVDQVSLQVQLKHKANGVTSQHLEQINYGHYQLHVFIFSGPNKTV